MKRREFLVRTPALAGVAGVLGSAGPIVGAGETIGVVNGIVATTAALEQIPARTGIVTANVNVMDMPELRQVLASFKARVEAAEAIATHGARFDASFDDPSAWDLDL